MVSDRPTCRPTGMRHWISAPDKSRLTRFHKQVLVPPLWRKIKCFAAHGKLFLSVFACFPIFQSGCLLFPFWASEKKKHLCNTTVQTKQQQWEPMCEWGTLRKYTFILSHLLWMKTMIYLHRWSSTWVRGQTSLFMRKGSMGPCDSHLRLMRMPSGLSSK